jgi:hypothetical protein
MSTLKIAMIACGLALTLASGAQAYELRLGNGTSVVTVNPDNAATTRAGTVAGERSLHDRVIGRAANGTP